MAIKYSIYQNPPRPDGQEPARHVQVKNLTPADNYAVAKRMTKLNKLYSEGTNIGALVMLREALEELVAEGCSIQLDGIGTFTPKVSADIEMRNDRRGKFRLHTRNMQVSGIDFQPSEKLLRGINCKVKFEWVAGVRTTAVSDEELRDFLDRHFAEHDTLTRADIVEGLGISKDRARTYLNKLVAAGTLLREGVRATTCYRLVNQ